MEEFFDEVDVGQNHTTTAITLELELVEGIAEHVGLVRRERHAS